MLNNVNQSPVDEKDLKSQALLERISQLTTQYEEQVANLRVALTVISNERDQLKAAAEAPEETNEPTETKKKAS